MEPLVIQPSPWMILPFGTLLAAIALAPLFFSKFWARHYPKISFLLGVFTLAYYFFSLKASVRVQETAIEYLSFIALIGSLFVVSGGIHLRVKGESTPSANVVFLFIGAVVANFVGTTGASMLLIRPWLRMNKYRVTGYHVVFFIFIVSNVGGCLTPIGDPPLFLGYLKGVPFWWVARQCWPMWAVGIGVLLAMFYWVDRRNYLRAPKAIREKLAEPGDEWRFEGLSNLLFLAVIIGAVFINEPTFLRELLMASAALASYCTTRHSIHQANEFNFHPIKEVAILFAGIFATMMPALDWLQVNAGQLGQPTPALYYWASGSLSSVLDNAPTYLSFLSAGFGSILDPAMVGHVRHLLTASDPSALASLAGPQAEQIRLTLRALQIYHGELIAHGHITNSQIQTAMFLANPGFSQFLLAISVGSVFFGANTYIGNGPNFMVKAIAEQCKVRHVPGFLGYIAYYTLPFMIPMLAIVWFLFFRG